jgi:hypothetical protein
MPRRLARMRDIVSIGVERMADLADSSARSRHRGNRYADNAV